jgi:hypothetical protein
MIVGMYRAMNAIAELWQRWMVPSASLMMMAGQGGTGQDRSTRSLLVNGTTLSDDDNY